MPKIRTSKTKPPAGWELLEGTLNEFEAKMRDVESAPHEGKRKTESLWPIIRVHHQRSRFVFNMYHVKHEISKELYDWCVKEGHADAALMAKWRKPGYERLCCLTCIQTKEHNYGTACICRVTRDRLDPGRMVECVHCGCHGCFTSTGEDDYVADLGPARAATLAAYERKEKEKAEAAARRAAAATATPAPHAGGRTTAPAASMPFPFPFPMPPGMPAFPWPMPPLGPGGAPAPGGAFPFPFPMTLGMMPFPPPPGGWPMPPAPVASVDHAATGQEDERGAVAEHDAPARAAATEAENVDARPSNNTETEAVAAGDSVAAEGQAST